MGSRDGWRQDVLRGTSVGDDTGAWTRGRTWMDCFRRWEKDEWRFVAAEKQLIVAAGLERIMMSADGGETWVADHGPHRIVAQVRRDRGSDGRDEIWGRRNARVFYLSSDKGSSWPDAPEPVSSRDVDSLLLRRARWGRVLVTANGQAYDFAFRREGGGTRKVSFWDTGLGRYASWRPVGDHLLGATPFTMGVVIQPRMVESAAR